MHSFRFSQESTDIVTFDGVVLEVFKTMFESGSRRYHVGHIEDIFLETDGKGNHKLRIKAAYGVVFPEVRVDEQAVGQAGALIAEVRQVLAAMKR